MGLSLKVRMHDRVSVKLRGALRALRDRRKAHQAIKERQIQQWEINFDSNGALYGDWPPLAESTLADRDRDGAYGFHILIRRGNLFASFLRVNKSGKVDPSRTYWDLFTPNPPYLFTHHFGFGPSGGFRSHVPSRKLWGLNHDDEVAAKEILEEYVDEIIARYF